MNKEDESLTNGEKHAALISIIEIEVWPRTMAEVGVQDGMTVGQLLKIADSEIQRSEYPMNLRLRTELFKAALLVAEVDDKTSRAWLADTVKQILAFAAWRKTKEETATKNADSN